MMENPHIQECLIHLIVTYLRTRVTGPVGNSMSICSLEDLLIARASTANSSATAVLPFYAVPEIHH